MAANSRGQMRPHQANRTPSFIVIGLLVVIAILAFNYWNISSKNNVLSKEILDLTERIRLASVKKTAVEKRNDALMQKVRESEQELTRQKSLFAKKEDEVSNANEQCRGKSQELDQCKGETTKLRDDVENCHQKEQDLNTKLKDAEDLKIACDKQLSEAKKCQDQVQSAQDKAGCAEEKQAYSKVLQIIMRLWGGSALLKLHQSGVDVSPVVDPSQLQNVQGQKNNIPMVQQEGGQGQVQRQGPPQTGQDQQNQQYQGQQQQAQQGQGIVGPNQGDAANVTGVNVTSEGGKMNMTTSTSSAFDTNTTSNTSSLVQAPQQPPQNQQLAPPQGAAGVNGVPATPGYQQAPALPQAQEGIAQGGAQDRYQQRQADAQPAQQQQEAGNAQLGQAGGDSAAATQGGGPVGQPGKAGDVGANEHHQAERYGPAVHDNNGARGHEMENPVPPAQVQEEQTKPPEQVKQPGDRSLNEPPKEASYVKAPMGQVGEKAPLGNTGEQNKEGEPIQKGTNDVPSRDGLQGGLRPAASQEGGKAAELEQKQNEVAPDSRPVDDIGLGRNPEQNAPQGQVAKPRMVEDGTDKKQGHAANDVEKAEDNIDRMHQRFQDRPRT